jgi:uncharacterized protein YfaP (DUF2135 family)
MADQNQQGIPDQEEMVFIDDDDLKKAPPPVMVEGPSLGPVYAWLVLLTLAVIGLFVFAFLNHKELREVADKVDQINNKVTALDDARKGETADAQKKKLDDLDLRVTDGFRDVNKRLDGMADVKNLKDDLQRLADADAALNGKVDALGQSVTVSNAKREELDAALKALAARVAILEEKCKDCGNEKDTMAAFSKKFDDLKTRDTGNDDKFTQIMNRLNSIEDKLKAPPVPPQPEATFKVKITQPSESTELAERFIEVSATVDDATVTDGEMVVSWLNGRKERPSRIEFKNGVYKNQIALASGVNVITVKAKKGDQTATDSVKVTCSAKTSKMRVILNWNGYCDLDLHIIDPRGNEAFYNAPRLPSGGFLDRDDKRTPGDQKGKYEVTPGPETFLISPEMGHQLVPGEYIIKVVAFKLRDEDGQRQENLVPPVKAEVQVILNESDPANVKISNYPVEMSKEKEEKVVAKVTLDAR